MAGVNEAGWTESIIVLESEVRNQVFSAQMTKRVLEFHQLNKDVMLGIETGSGLRGLEVEG